MAQFDRRLLAHATPVRGLLALDAAVGVGATILLLAQVTVLAVVLAGVVDGPDRTVPIPALLALAALLLARAALAWLVEVAGRRVATTSMSSLRTALLARRLRHGGSDVDGLDGASMATAAVQGVDGLEVYFAKFLPQIVLAVVVPVAVVVWVTFIDVTSALILIVTLPLIPLFMWLIGRTTESRAARSLATLEMLSSYFLDVVRGLPTLRAFNRGKAQIPRIREVSERLRRATMGTLRLSFLSGFVLDLATTLSIALIAVTLGLRLIGGSMELRPALIVLLLVPELYAPVRAVGTLYHASADGLAGARRILDVLDRPEPSGPDAMGIPVTPTAGVGAIELRGVTVAYPDRPNPALDDVDLRLERGDFVAIVGPSGAGKTTLGRVLLGLTRPTHGSVVVDGVALTEDALDEWRWHVSWAAQRPALLHDTVAANIALGRPDTPPTSIEEAARRAGAHAFIDGLPNGYATVIGTGGRGLSAGQRQRVGLARALLRGSPLVVLDEPTAYLDAGAAETVEETIRGLDGSCTLVVLTHDPHLAEMANRIVRIDAGRLHAAAGDGYEHLGGSR